MHEHVSLFSLLPAKQQEIVHNGPVVDHTHVPIHECKNTHINYGHFWPLRLSLTLHLVI